MNRTLRLIARPHWVWLFATLIAANPARAQNRGVYPLGMSAINSGVTPEPGFSYTNQLLFYVRDQAKDDDGKTLPIAGANTVVMDMNSLTWVSNKRILGARYAASATLPFAKNDLTSDIEGQISGGIGFADSYYLPLILGWSTERVAVRAMYGFLAPTGRFVPGANNNVGSGHWTHALSSGQTYYLTRDRRLILSTFELYEFHTTQEGTHIHPGETFDADYSLLGSIHRTASLGLQMGITGYEARQTTAKTGPDITPAVSAERYAINAIGLAFVAVFPKRKASLGFRYFKEFADRSTFQGYSAQVSGGIGF
jgi:hypothetical protein